MRRGLLWLVVVVVWASLLWAGILWGGRELRVPTIGSPEVQTYTPAPPRPVPFPRSTLPPTWTPWTDTVKP